MSNDTRQAIDDAINAHIADTFPGYYTDAWVVVCASSNIENPSAKNYRVVTPDTQPFHADIGLISVGQEILSDVWADDDEDD